MYYGYFDGSATPNPGKLGCGFCIYKEGKEVLCGAGPAGHGTNNEAEYISLIRLLEQCIHLDIKVIRCFGDSQLIVKQVNGEWNVGSSKLQTLAKKVNDLINQLDKVELAWIPRAKNIRADMLSKRGSEMTEAAVKIRNQTSNRNSVVNISERRGKSLVMPMASNELVILENDVPIYINVPKMCCSCASFVKNNNCRHANALKNVLSKKIV